MHDRFRLAAVMVVALIALHPGGRSTSAQAPPARDPFVGTFANEQLSVTLRATGDGYEGQATYQGQTFRVQARVTGGRMSGVYSTRGQTMPFEAAVQEGRMFFLADGVTYVLQRGGGDVAASSQDQQISRLLLSSAWCSFRSSQTTGASSSERTQFFPDGTLVSGSNSESYSSGRYGSVAGQSRGGQRGRWRVQNGALLLTEDGVSWSAHPLRIPQNSNGYPIITADGKEYSQCR